MVIIPAHGHHLISFSAQKANLKLTSASVCGPMLGGGGSRDGGGMQRGGEAKAVPPTLPFVSSSLLNTLPISGAKVRKAETGSHKGFSQYLLQKSL